MKLITHDAGCGGPAFYSLKMCGAFNAYPSSHVDDLQSLDGGKPEVDMPLRCGTCGEIWHMLTPSVIRVQGGLPTLDSLSEPFGETSNIPVL